MMLLSNVLYPHHGFIFSPLCFFSTWEPPQWIPGCVPQRLGFNSGTGVGNPSERTKSVCQVYLCWWCGLEQLKLCYRLCVLLLNDKTSVVSVLTVAQTVFLSPVWRTSILGIVCWTKPTHQTQCHWWVHTHMSHSAVSILWFKPWSMLYWRHALVPRINILICMKKNTSLFNCDFTNRSLFQLKFFTEEGQIVFTVNFQVWCGSQYWFEGLFSFDLHLTSCMNWFWGLDQIFKL